MSIAPIQIFGCSPRPSGNSDFMVHNFVQGVRSAGGQADVHFLRDYTIIPCNVCHHCAEDPQSQCILASRDDVETIFQHMLQARIVFFAAPIFFYHIPAKCKGLIDRAQSRWVQREKVRKQGLWTANPNPKAAIVGLVAARARGDKIFEGSMLTLQYFLDLFDYRIAESCRLTGYDGPEDLASDGVACMRLYELGAQAQAMIVEGTGRQNS